MKKNVWKLSSVLLVLAMLVGGLVACGPTPEPEVVEKVVKETVIVEGTPQTVEKVVTEVVEKEVEIETVVTATPEPTRKIITVSWRNEPDSLNPPYSNMWESLSLRQLYLGWLWDYDDQNVAHPHFVTEIPSMENGGVVESEDGLVITMHLRDDLVWSDGVPLTADDFVFMYNMTVDPANTVTQVYPYGYVDSFEAPDEHTVVMSLNERLAPWKVLFEVSSSPLPKHILQPVYEAEGSLDEAEWNRAPTVGCGPFSFAEWESGSFLHFVRNENYWGEKAKLDEIYFQFVPDDAAQTAAILAGDADLGVSPPLSDVPLLQAGGLDVRMVSRGSCEGWFFNFRDMASPGARDVKVRQAIAMAIDRDAMRQDLMKGLSGPVETFWEPLKSEGYESPDIEPWEYDPEAAKQLLEDAGWVDRDGDGIREDAEGNKLTLTHGTSIQAMRQDVQAITQEMLREVGIDLQISSYDIDRLFASYGDGSPCALGDLDIMEWRDSTYFPDPDISCYWLCSELATDDNPWGCNYFGCDEFLDELFQRELTTISHDERVNIFQEISKYMHEQVYWLGLWTVSDIWMVGPRLTNVELSGTTPFYNIAEWDLKE